jgi:hypothetical protein
MLQYVENIHLSQRQLNRLHDHIGYSHSLLGACASGERSNANKCYKAQFCPYSLLAYQTNHVRAHCHPCISSHC